MESFVDAAEAWLAEAERVDPAKSTWTFCGPGRADFWFGRASTELAVHRRDAEGAFIDAPSISPERASDGIAETIDALFPVAALLGTPPSGTVLAIIPDDRPERWIVVPTEDGSTIDQTATPSVTFRGHASSLLLHFWSRSLGHIEASGAEDDVLGWEGFFPGYAIGAD